MKPGRDNTGLIDHDYIALGYQSGQVGYCQMLDGLPNSTIDKQLGAVARFGRTLGYSPLRQSVVEFPHVLGPLLSTQIVANLSSPNLLVATGSLLSTRNLLRLLSSIDLDAGLVDRGLLPEIRSELQTSSFLLAHGPLRVWD